MPGAGKAPATAPAPGPSGSYCYTALDVLQASGQYSTLLNLLDDTDMGNLLDDPRSFAFCSFGTACELVRCIEDTLAALGTNFLTETVMTSGQAAAVMLQVHYSACTNKRWN